MNIDSIKWQDDKRDAVIATIDGAAHIVPVSDNNRHWQRVKKWVDVGNTIENEDAPLPEPTKDEVVDRSDKVLIAFIKAYAKREGLTLAQIKTAVTAEMN